MTAPGKNKAIACIMIKRLFYIHNFHTYVSHSRILYVLFLDEIHSRNLKFESDNSIVSSSLIRIDQMLGQWTDTWKTWAVKKRGRLRISLKDDLGVIFFKNRIQTEGKHVLLWTRAIANSSWLIAGKLLRFHLDLLFVGDRKFRYETRRVTANHDIQIGECGGLIVL